ncbi:hypothetical protein N9W49_02175, partial [Alphaproteobacteria bacterium]|nr:hypothetical protein [Alphaproteobacteria bacterium]
MSRRAQILLLAALFVFTALSLAYVNRTSLIISAIGFASKMGNSVAPNRAVRWQTGGLWQGTGQRPPQYYCYPAR